MDNPSQPGALPPSGRIDIPVAHGHLEALLKEPARPAIAAAVVCHPHPRHGGTMNNNVIYRTAKALNDAGVIALRFNFRGVGRSTGSYGGGIGEEEDAEAALELLRGRYPDLPLWMAGFSFGARVGLTVGARDPRVAKLLGVGLALNMFDYNFLTRCRKPKALVQASEDEYGGRDAITALHERLPPPKALFVVDGATHLFPKHLDAMEQAASDATAALIAEV
jgi:alpha/beta superfamily hydrolase